MSKNGTTPPTDPVLAFGKNVTEDSVFTYSQFEELQKFLKLTVQERSMMAVTGKSGLGKTTALRAFTFRLPNNRYSVMYLGQDQDGQSLLHRLALALGLKPKRFRAQLPMQISQALSDNVAEGGKEVIAVVDEAHLLDARTLEDIRLLTNREFDTQSPLAVILLGQQLLRIKLKAPELEALNQRLKYKFFLEGFSLEETAAYIKHRLSSSGVSPELFSEEAIKKIFDASEGVPREINTLCTLAIVKAQSNGSERIDGKLIKQLVSQRELS
ncbi:MAG: AAA family ATPase [Nitrososphaera sp.]|nr:AAA family ATPase [Nitrososphaera sp.]